MIATSIKTDPKNLSKPIKTLLERLKTCLNQTDSSKTAPLIQVSVPVSPMDVFLWLARRPETQKMYWADRSGRIEVAGAGIAHEVCSTRRWVTITRLCSA